MTKSHEPITVGLMSREQGFFTQMETSIISSETAGGLPCKAQRIDPFAQYDVGGTGVVLIDLDSLTDDALRQIPGIRQQNVRAWIAVSYQNPSAERLLKAVRAGANDYLRSPPTQSEFQDLLLRARQMTQGQGARVLGQVITVFGNSGGAGTTTLATQVAASLANKFRPSGSVVLVDLVFQRGDVSAFLDVPTKYSVVNLVTELDRADSSYLQSVLPRHSSGVFVLPSPYASDEADSVTAVQISRMLHALRSVFDAVVVDAGHGFSDPVLSALDASSRILLLTLPTLTSIRNSRRTLEVFDRLGYDTAKIISVLNRHDAQGKVDPADIEETLGRPIHWSIPNDYETAVRTIHKASTFHAVQPQGKLAVNIDQLVAKHILGQTAAPSPAPSSRLVEKPRASLLGQLQRWKVLHGTP